jgi:uncharacterized membrane protein
MKIKQLGILALFLIIASTVAAIAAAADVPVTVDDVKIDGESLQPNNLNRLNFEKGEEIDVKVIITANEDAENVQVEAEIKGYEHSERESTSDITHVFDVEENVTYTKRLKVTVPTRADEDDYKLRVTITDRYNDEIIQNYNIKIDSPRHSMEIRDIVLTPENEVRAGRALLAAVRVRNLGDRDEDSVKVTVKIPSLGLSASDYIDEVEEDDSETSEELYLRIPACAEAGEYDVVAEVEYDDGYEEISKATSIEVLESDVCEASSSDEDDEEAEVPDVVLGSKLEDVVAGQGGAIFPVTITNNAGRSKTFSLDIEGVDGWGTVKISPTNTVVIKSGDSEELYVFVGANNDAPAGPQLITATVKAGSEKVEQATLTANVVGSSADGWDTAKKGLEIALVVLVALLVILGLIIGFSKIKNEEEGPNSHEAETYY